MKRSVCIISFSPVARDARVLRQIECLALDYRLTVIGFGEPVNVSGASEPITWIRMPETETRLGKRIVSRLMWTMLPCVNVLPFPRAIAQRVYEAWFWSGPCQDAAICAAMCHPCHAYCANDWTALPIAAEAAKRHGARLVFDAHEYAPLELEESLLWKLRHERTITHFLKKYGPLVDGFMTVSPGLGERYREVFDLRPTVVLNAPRRQVFPSRSLDPNDIRLVHHGRASRDRRLETMIDALALSEARFSLHFMFTNVQSEYVHRLQKYAARVASGRVYFHPPVRPDQVVREIAQYDLGLYVLEPTNFNTRHALPNKFFDFIVAGLPVCIGPSPEMAAIVRQHGCGCIADSFQPQDVAKALNALDECHIIEMQRAAREAAGVFNGETEMGRVRSLFQALL